MAGSMIALLLAWAISDLLSAALVGYCGVRPSTRVRLLTIICTCLGTMICERCRTEFFSPGTWTKLRDGEKFDILHRACEAPEPNDCTVCSTILKDTIAALSASPATSGYAKDEQSVEHWRQQVKTWPQLPVKAERRIGRLSFIVGPCSANFTFQDQTICIAVSLKARLFIMSPTPRGTEKPSSTLGFSTESEESIQQAKAWLQACNGGHEHVECSAMAKSQMHRMQPSDEDVFVPTRLLDVGTIDNPEIRLVGDTHKAKVRGPYTTLSHMWGIPMGDRFALTSSNYDQFCRCIDETDPKLTLTFKQGMQVTRRIGVRYLWIDSICINQGDNADFVRESTKMEEIYRNSYCNIAAVDSENGSQGLFRKRSPSDLPPDMVEFDGRTYTLLRPDFWDQQVLKGPLYSRGWVLQERMLTPRILHFTKEQIFWQCPSLTACESSPVSLPFGVHGEEAKLELKWRRALHQNRLTELDMADLNAIWKHVVRSYTSCNLTFSGDKLIALSGIATAMQRGLDERFLAGLWDSTLLENRPLADLGDQLCWTAASGKKIDGSPCTRYREYRAPSWSWASLDGVITLRDRIIERNPVPTFEIKNAKVTLQDAVWVTGPVKSEGTRLDLHGQMLPMEFHAASVEWHRWEWRCDSIDGEFTFYALLDDLDEAKLMCSGDYEHSIIAEVIILACDIPDGLYAGHGLVLRQNKQAGDTYTRAGCVTFSGLTKAQWNVVMEKSAWKEITLL